MDLPCVLIISTVVGKPNEIAVRLGAEPLSDQDGFEYHLLNIDNKYYTSQVLLCGMTDPQSNISIDNIEVLIIYHEPQMENAKEQLEKWIPVISSLSEAETLLFCCNSISDIIIRAEVSEWCLQRKFELIELTSHDSSKFLEVDGENNKYGIERIIEALHTHMWPNMIMKGKPAESTDEVNQVEEQLEQMQLNHNTTERVQMESVLAGIMGGENTDFGELFGQLMAMKEHAASLPTNQRRIAAEQLVKAFWNAMGGDPSEIED